MRRLLLLLVLAPLWASAQSVVAVDAFGVDVFAPVDLVVAPGQPDRVYVVEQGVSRRSSAARVRTLRPGDAEATTFVDLGDRVFRGGEAGLLGLAFHPDYATNGLLYLSYTSGTPGDAADPFRSVVSEVQRSSGDALTADLSTERVLLEVPQPDGNHNAGQITFGPDGFLYIALGDGGGGGDPGNHGQRPETLLGSILRIDVDTRTEGAYGIPDDNPFAETDGPERRETYAYGFRNPWKFAFDRETGDLWAMDVGQSSWEEINRVEKGGNYGWNPVEGPECFLSGCDQDAYLAPVFSYDHSDETGGFSISGGMVYRGDAIPGLDGHVLYADYVKRRIWAFDASRTEVTNADTTRLLTSSREISAVREGPDGEPYVLSYSMSDPTRILRLEAVPVDAEDGPERARALRPAGPNPFREATALAVELATGGRARATLHDALGREVRVLFEGALGPGEARRLEVAGLGLAPGVYTVRLVAGDEVFTRQLVRLAAAH